MKQAEKGLVAFAAGFVTAVICVVVFAGSWLNSQPWFGALSNIIQIVSGPGTFAVVVGVLWARWHGRCATPGCLRRGEHPVDGTVRKVCTHHHTADHHLAVHALHAVEGRLGWGQSHTTTRRRTKA